MKPSVNEIRAKQGIGVIENLFFLQMFFPYRWHPDIIDTQMLQVGNIIIAAVPGEFTTMAGRFVEKKRIKNTYFKYLINFYFCFILGD